MMSNSVMALKNIFIVAGAAFYQLWQWKRWDQVGYRLE
jgi:hypothetical protein